jgi:putative glutamine amidotransferase
MPKKRPVIGIITNRHLINDQYEVHASGSMATNAVAEVCDAVPILIPGDPALSEVAELREICDGFMLTGGRPNVHPDEYGHEETEAHGTFDRDRDRVALDLIRSCVATGQPIFGICRGFQEFNVAMGGTLHPEIRDLPGRMNHRMPPDGTLEEKFELRHWVEFTPGGPFARMMGATRVMTNTLHGQGIEEPGPRVVIDGRAEDSTAEAVYIEGAPGFALAVQWHPEWNAAQDPVSRKLFEAFGAAAREWSGGMRAVARSA